jgi:hypothetical protein
MNWLWRIDHQTQTGDVSRNVVVYRKVSHSTKRGKFMGHCYPKVLINKVL